MITLEEFDIVQTLEKMEDWEWLKTRTRSIWEKFIVGVDVYMARGVN